MMRLISALKATGSEALSVFRAARSCWLSVELSTALIASSMADGVVEGAASSASRMGITQRMMKEVLSDMVTRMANAHR
jgi:hypothetical protein